MCDPQCWYDSFVYTPEGYPDMVYVGGDYAYGETTANKRGVVLSTDAGVSGTDMTFDGTDPLHPNGLHPDQHAIVTNPNNPFQFFEANDGGVMRSSGELVYLSYPLVRIVILAGAVAIGILMWLALNRTKIGLLIRAGVENTEMVEALGYRITRLFVGVFMAGSALAGLGGVMWGLYREQVTATMGSELLVLVFIVVIIGGLGSVTGCFIGALLVALVTNYSLFFAPKLANVAEIGLMVAILLWRPRGLYPVTSR
jgi:branched-subunit amino acid ABC-type transport system permease component